jgi:hypothetical protein
MGAKPKQRIYTTEFKREAVRLLETSGKSGAKNSFLDKVYEQVVSFMLLANL